MWSTYCILVYLVTILPLKPVKSLDVPCILKMGEIRFGVSSHPRSHNSERMAKIQIQVFLTQYLLLIHYIPSASLIQWRAQDLLCGGFNHKWEIHTTLKMGIYLKISECVVSPL